MDILNKMKAYVEVVDAGGYSPAARKIGRSKALLSKYVRELEDELGTLLINRTTRQFSLTEAGRLYYESSLEIIGRIDDINESVRLAGKGVGGRLRVTAPRSMGGSRPILPLIEFARAYPDIDLDIHLDDRVVDLVEERYDVAIRAGQMGDSSLIARRIAQNSTRICASPSFLEKHGTPRTPKDLASLPCIIDTNIRGRNSWPLVDENGGALSQPVNGVIEINDPEICKQAALEGLGIALLPMFVISVELESGQLVPLLEEHMPPATGMYVVYAHRRHVPAKVRVFVDFMAEHFKKNCPQD